MSQGRVLVDITMAMDMTPVVMVGRSTALLHSEELLHLHCCKARGNGLHLISVNVSQICLLLTKHLTIFRVWNINTCTNIHTYIKKMKT